MVRLDSMKQDLALEDAGRWFEHPEFTGARFLIARTSNRKFVEYARRRRADVAAENVARQVKGILPDSGLTDAQSVEVYHDALSRFVLLGWEGIEGADGQPLPYSPQAAQTLMADQEFKDVAAWVLRQASEGAAYRKRAQEEAAGN